MESLVIWSSQQVTGLNLDHLLGPKNAEALPDGISYWLVELWTLLMGFFQDRNMKHVFPGGVLLTLLAHLHMRLDFFITFPSGFDLGSVVAAEIAAESLVPISAMPRVFPAASKSLHRGKLDEMKSDRGKDAIRDPSGWVYFHLHLEWQWNNLK